MFILGLIEISNLRLETSIIKYLITNCLQCVLNFHIAVCLHLLLYTYLDSRFISKKMKTIFSLKIFKIMVYFQATHRSFCIDCEFGLSIIVCFSQFSIIGNWDFSFYCDEQNRKCFWLSIKWVIYLVRGAYILIWKSGLQFLNGSTCGLPVTGHICLVSMLFP